MCVDLRRFANAGFRPRSNDFNLRSDVSDKYEMNRKTKRDIPEKRRRYIEGWNNLSGKEIVTRTEEKGESYTTSRDL